MSHPDYVKFGTPEERFVEEVGEALQALGKMKRFGPFSTHPERPDSYNIKELIKELDDVLEHAAVFKKELEETLDIRERFGPTPMYIYSKPGTKVRFIGRNGYDSELKRAMIVFDMKKWYTVKRTDVYSSSTTVYFEEVEAGWNSVMFTTEV